VTEKAHFDPRLTPARPDLAADFLKGKVEAARFVSGERREVFDAQTPLRREPSPDAALDTEALKGERATIYDTNEEGWCWGQLESDRYVGWLPANALVAPGPEPTHRVSVLRTIVFPGPSIKAPPIEMLSMGARVAIARIDEKFAITPSGFCLPKNHLVPLNVVEEDFVAVAERFVGVPYLWGGKTSLGLDCSSLVQISLMACGIASPRDCDMQEQELGSPIDAGSDFTRLQRGDLVFWKGHVAIVRDRGNLLHANSYSMNVTIEPLTPAIKRISARDNPVTDVRRLSIEPQ
jgi:cell wall-associated NlpC family hydrolase